MTSFRPPAGPDSWSVPAPEAIRAPCSRASAALRVISSWVAGQSRPMLRCAVSMASATPEPVAEQVGPEREGGLPVDDRRRARHVLAARVGDDVGGGEGDPRPEARRMLRPGPRLGEFDLAASRRRPRAATTVASWSVGHRRRTSRSRPGAPRPRTPARRRPAAARERRRRGRTRAGGRRRRRPGTAPTAPGTRCRTRRCPGSAATGCGSPRSWAGRGSRPAWASTPGAGCGSRTGRPPRSRGCRPPGTRPARRGRPGRPRTS